VPDVWTVAMGNGIYVDACQSCWQKWPWEHRLYPPVGFGRTKAASGHITMDELIELLAA
jgi:hypothetical protein